MNINNRADIVEKLSLDPNLITLENVFFNSKEHMDIEVFFSFLQAEDSSKSLNTQFKPDDLMLYRDVFDNNLLHMAEVSGNNRLAYQLINYVPKLMYQTNQWGQYPIHFSCLNDLGLQKYPHSLLTCMCHNQQNLLHISASVGTVSNVQWLLQYTTNLMDKTEFLNGLPLHCALNVYSPEPHRRVQKIITSKIMLHYLGPYKAKQQLNYRSDLNMRPKDLINFRLQPKEVDFLLDNTLSSAGS